MLPLQRVFNRPGVAGVVLQTPLSLIQSLGAVQCSVVILSLQIFKTL